MRVFEKHRACNGDYIISGSNTSYVAVVDPEGNGCSFICSISSNFGTGIIPEDCGFALHLLLNMIIFGMDPQVALNQPRFFIGNCKMLTDFPETLSMLSLEEGIPPSVVPSLKAKGHEVVHPINGFGRVRFGIGNIIAQPALWNRDAKDSQKSWWAGAEPRADGSALGF